uniref:SCP domain-containing protein n=1 Tax=Parastrongyloides trichosuri TaxID=131310 RepID=A0A0N4ZDD9_PARTI
MVVSSVSVDSSCSDDSCAEKCKKANKGAGKCIEVRDTKKSFLYYTYDGYYFRNITEVYQYLEKKFPGRHFVQKENSQSSDTNNHNGKFNNVGYRDPNDISRGIRPPNYLQNFQFPTQNNYKENNNLNPSTYYKDQKIDWKNSLTEEDKRRLAGVPIYIDPSHLRPYPLTSNLVMYYYYQQHDKYRACHGVPPLQVSNDLITEAQIYANYLSSIDTMQHDESVQKEGKNLALSSIEVGYANVDIWYDEWKLFNFTSMEYNHNARHFTQIVWSASKLIGCGSAISRTNQLYVVCRYYPSGNVLMEFRNNIPPRVSCLPFVI